MGMVDVTSSSNSNGGGNNNTVVDNERRPLLYGQPYSPPPTPLSPEDIVQRRRSLGIDSASIDGEVASLGGNSEGNIECGDSDDQLQRPHNMYGQQGCWEDSCVVVYCC
ncbi:hypothetical protein IWW48_002601 [Coemansia sp. RSA 1200]|nr:hypothetical protein IWW48_002601 [Coemansia sp. RSA 1200]